MQDFLFQVSLLTSEIRAERNSVSGSGFCGCGNGDVEERYIDFDEFFEMMKDRIVKERRHTKNVEFEAHSSNVSCLLWI